MKSLGGAAALAFVALVLALPHLVWIDDRVWSIVLVWRGCGTDRLVERSVDVATWMLALLFLVTLVAAVRGGDGRRAWAALTVAGLGLLANGVMKELFARERPSNLPDVVIGHSFPSGHVMNSALAGILIVVLARRLPHGRRLVVPGVALALLTSSGRVLFAHHWMLDAVGAVLAAVALAALAFAAFERRPLLAPSLAALACLAVLVLATRVSIALPSPLTAGGADVIEVDVGSPEAASALTGAWESPIVEHPGGSLAWLTGAGTVTVTLPPTPAGEGLGTLVIAGRPDAAEVGCRHVTVSLDDRRVASFVPFRGWREYRLSAAVVRSGANRVVLETALADGRPARFAVAYVGIRRP